MMVCVSFASVLQHAVEAASSLATLHATQNTSWLTPVLSKPTIPAPPRLLLLAGAGLPSGFLFDADSQLDGRQSA
jgi:hypothetical protein